MPSCCDAKQLPAIWPKRYKLALNASKSASAAAGNRCIKASEHNAAVVSGGTGGSRANACRSASPCKPVVERGSSSRTRQASGNSSREINGETSSGRRLPASTNSPPTAKPMRPDRRALAAADGAGQFAGQSERPTGENMDRRGDGHPQLGSRAQANVFAGSRLDLNPAGRQARELQCRSRPAAEIERRSASGPTASNCGAGRTFKRIPGSATISPTPPYCRGGAARPRRNPARARTKTSQNAAGYQW